MSKLEKISERCLAVCQVPKAISADAVRNYFESRFVNGRISDIDAVDGIESRNDQTRLVLLCTSVQDVDYMCQKVKEEAIHIGENQFTVRYQKAIACELPDKWENMEIPEEDNRQPGVMDSQVQGPQQPHAAPVPPHLRPMQQHPAEIGQQARPSFPWPYGPYGPMSGPYHNIPLNAQGAPDQMQGGGDQRLNQGGMPMQMPMYGGAPGQPPGQGNEHQPGLAPRIPHGMGHNRPPGPQQFGQQNQHFPYGQIPPGFNMFRMPQGFQSDPNNAQGGQNMPYHSGMRMPMPMFFDPNTGQMIPAPGFPNVQPHPAQVGGGPRGPHPPQHRAPPPPYNGAKFKGQDEDYTTEIKSPVDRADSERARQSQAVADQAEELQKLQTKVHREIQAESTDYEEIEPQHDSENEKYTTEESEKLAKILVSNLPSTAHIEYLEMFFENQRTFPDGITVFNVDLDEENSTAIVEFHQPEAVDIVLGKCPLVMMGQEVEVEIYKPEAPIQLCTIEVTGPCSIVSEAQLETLEMYFESERRSGGGEIVDTRYDNDMNMALITFASEEVAQRVEERGNHFLKREPLTVRLHAPTKQPKQPKMKEEIMEKDPEESRTVKVKGVDKTTSRDTLEFYFENSRRSGGGEIEEINSDEEEDVIYVKFKSIKDAENIVKRGSHTVENRKLEVSLYTPPVPPPCYENKILIKGLNPSTTQDCLFNFIEAKSNFEPESMDYHSEQEGVVMITFTEDIDFNELKKVFGNNKLEGASLKVDCVPISNCIIVDNLASDVTSDTLEFYFENKRKSGGGAVDKVVRNEDNDTFLVYFEDYTVIDKVLERKHELSKQQLDVKRYQECLGRPEGDVGEKKLTKPEPVKLKDVNCQKLKFLKKSKPYHEALEKQMQSCYAHIQWPTDGSEVILECTLTKDVKDCFKLVKTWKKEAEDSLDHFLNTIAVHQISVLQDIWAKVMEQLKLISITNPEAVAVFVDKNEGFVTVVGNKPGAEILAKNISEILKNVTDEAERERQKVKEIYNSLKPIETKMLLADKFPNKMMDMFPEMTVKINQTKNEIVFEGSLANVRDAKIKMFEMKNEFASKSIENIAALSAGLFKVKQTKEYIVKKLKSQSVTGVWEILDQTLIIYSSSRDNIGQCVSIIHGSVLETSIVLTKASASVMNSEAWQYKVEELHSQYAGRAHIAVDDSLSKVTICSTDDFANEILDGVKKFLRYNTVLEEKVPCTKNVHRLIEKHHKQEISAICRDLQNYHVNITTEGYGGFKICGTEDGMIKSKDKLKQLFDRVKQRDHNVEKPGLVEHMKTARGKDNLNTIETTMPCVISVKGEMEENPTSENLYETIPANRGNKHIKVKASCEVYGCRNVYTAVGDMTEMSVQVLVNAADEKLSLRGGLGKAIVSKGGKEVEKACQDYIKKEGKLGDGEVFLCPAGNLKADYIVHVIGPVWKGGHNNEEDMLEEAVFKCMQQATINDAKSIAIPAISCGVYGYPVKRATTTIVNAVKNFFREVQESEITDIYLCDVKANTVDCFTEALKQEFRNVKEEREEPEYDDYETDARRSRASRSGTYSEGEMDSDEDDDFYESSSAMKKPPPGAMRVFPGPPPVPKSRPPKRTPGSDSNQVSIGNLSVTMQKGEIAREKVDVIVNTTANNLDLKNGAVSASLLKCGGQNLQTEVSTNYPNGINFGEIAVSTGHNLKCSQVYHTTLSNYDTNNVTGCIDALHKLVTSCLAEAQRQKQTSIAYPAIGTGNLGFPKDIVAKEMFKAVSKFSTANSNSSVKDVRFIIYQKDFPTIKAFEAEKGRWSSGEFKTARQTRKVDPNYERVQHRRTDPESDDESEYDLVADSADSPYVNLKVTVKQGDITKEDSDCIVNSSNDTLDLSRGAVSKALLEKGGHALAKEIDRNKEKMGRSHLVWTSAPGIQCKHIVHVVAQDNNKGWKSIIDRCLQGAENKKLKSITFPALGTGFHSDPKEMADVMGCAFREFDKTSPSNLEEIRIVVFQKAMVQDFQRVLLTDGKQGSGFFTKFYNNVKGMFVGSKESEYENAEVVTRKKKKPENQDSVTFEILSMNNNVIQEAIKRLEGCLEKEIHRKEFKESIICRMDPNFIAEIEAVAKQHHVQIDTDQKSGKIQISGIANNLMNASDKIHGIMRDAVTMEKQKETAEIMSCLVQWFYIEITEETGQKLVEYDKTLNFKIESAFKLQEAMISFVADERKYILDFKKMQEYAEDDPEDVVNVIRRDLFKEGASDTPPSWGDFKGNLKVVNLPNTDPEYQDIYQKFQASAGALQVKQIQRVQNKTLWNQYHAKKKQLEDQNPPNTKNENFLWHGTAEDAVDSINAHGFNRSYCGKNATAMGNGVYFAAQAAYSCQNTYSRPDRSGLKRMYYCRVLTGEYTRGNSGMRVPPAKPSGGSNAIYDSVVDNTSGPGMYIIFNDTQAYPEYLVTFAQ